MDVPDPEQARAYGGWVAGIATFFATVLGIYKVREKRADVLDTRFDSKANVRDIDAANERITRHKEANQQQVTKHHDAILDLYKKNEKVIDLIREKEERDTGRHIELLKAIQAK